MPGIGVRHMWALPHGDGAGAIQKLVMSKVRPVVKLAIELLELTATRSGGFQNRMSLGSGSGQLTDYSDTYVNHRMPMDHMR